MRRESNLEKGTYGSLIFFQETRHQIVQLPGAARYEYRDNGIKCGVMQIAADRVLPVLSKWVVRKDELVSKLAENIDASGK